MSETPIGYCTNVHAGTSLDEVKNNLVRYAVPVREDVFSYRTMGVGLWLSDDSSRELVDRGACESFRDWLIQMKLDPYTFNGFPFGDFHQPVVKHAVYRPDWTSDQRLEYTKRLAKIQSTLLANRNLGTISTLPLGWPVETADDSYFVKCAKNLLKLTDYLADLREETGKRIQICIEPEPGCHFDTAVDLCSFFQNYLFSAGDRSVEQRVRDHLGVCHDICHSAVMFEGQGEAIKEYCDAGITIGKVQVSSAIEASFGQVTGEESNQLMQRVSEFCEPRYLHQTSIRTPNGVSFFEDLPLAIKANGDSPTGQWRVHFHVPIFQKNYEMIHSTQSDILDLLVALKQFDLRPQFEIETYAWGVLPERLQEEGLAVNLQRELQWFDDQLGKHGF